MANEVIKKHCVKRTRETEVEIRPSKRLANSLEDTCPNQKEIDSLPKQVSKTGWTGNTSIVTRFIRPNQDLHVEYYPQFLPSSSASQIFHQLQTQLQPYLDKSPNIVRLFGKTITIPRKHTAFGELGLLYTFSGVTLPCNPWLPLIETLKVTVEDAIAGETFNFALVNYYKDGADYIGEHQDNEAELSPKSSIASLSFGQERDFIFRHKDSRGKSSTRKELVPIKVFLNHGSLLLMKPPTNKYWYHSLPVRKKVHGPRINITFRKIIK